MIPAACGGWLTALEAKGTLDRATVFAPAIEYAELRRAAHDQERVLLSASPCAVGTWTSSPRAVFFSGGDVPPAGTIIKQPKLAETFRRVVEGGMDAFYRGPIAKEIVATVQAQGGLLSEEDLEEFQPFWEAPTSIDYRGYRIHSAPRPAPASSICKRSSCSNGSTSPGWATTAPRRCTSSWRR